MITTIKEFLSQNINIIFYHGSYKKFNDNFILLPQSDGYANLPSEKEIEKLFEKHKPKDKISRKNCVFLVTDINLIDYAGGFTDYIYKVEPIGKVEKSDLSWYTEAFGVLYSDEEDSNKFTIEECINNYWNSVPFIYSSKSCFEYRCNSAKIITTINNNVE
jgi:hypothetical protein